MMFFLIPPPFSPSGGGHGGGRPLRLCCELLRKISVNQRLSASDCNFLVGTAVLFHLFYV